MSKWIVVLLLGMASVNYCIAAFIDQVQDQYDANWFVIGSGAKVGQTFTSGMTGQLDSISIKFGNFQNVNDTPLHPVQVSIVQTNGLIPSGTALGTVTVSDFGDNFTYVDFSGFSIHLNVGTQYGILVSNDDPDLYDVQSTQWRASTQDLYSGGSAWIWRSDYGWIQESPESVTPAEIYYDKDLAFKTFIVPEPTTALLLSLGLIFNVIKRN